MNYSLFVEGRNGPVGEFQDFDDAWNYVNRIRSVRQMPGMDPYVVTIKSNITNKTQLITSALTKEVVEQSIS